MVPSFKSLIWQKKKSDVHVFTGDFAKKSSTKMGETTDRLTLNWCLVDLCHFLLQRRHNPPKIKNTQRWEPQKKSQKVTWKSNLHPIVCKTTSIFFSNFDVQKFFPIFVGILVTILLPFSEKSWIHSFFLTIFVRLQSTQLVVPDHLGGFTPGGGVCERSRALLGTRKFWGFPYRQS